jgi:hypothetical protein
MNNWVTCIAYRVPKLPKFVNPCKFASFKLFSAEGRSLSGADLMAGVIRMISRNGRQVMSRLAGAL